METKELEVVAAVGDMMVARKGEILVVTMVAVGTITILEITVHNSNHIMDP